MQKQFNFQLRQQNDRRDWGNIEVYYKTHCDRETAVRYARQISKTFKSEVRMTEGFVLYIIKHSLKFIIIDFQLVINFIRSYRAIISNEHSMF